MNNKNISYSDSIENEHFELEDKSWWFVHKCRLIAALADKFAQIRSFTEVGGGNGAVSYYLQERGYDVTMFEPLTAGADNARKRGVKNVERALFGSDTVNPNSVDNIGIFDVLEHIEDESAFLRELHTALKSDGKLFVSVPAYRGLWSESDDYLGHFRRYDRKMLTNRLENSGFAVEYSGYCFWFLPPAIWLFRHLPYATRTRPDKTKTPLKTKEFILPQCIHNFVLKLLSPEISAVDRRKSIPFGGSAFAVAAKSGGKPNDKTAS